MWMNSFSFKKENQLELFTAKMSSKHIGRVLPQVSKWENHLSNRIHDAASSELVLNRKTLQMFPCFWFIH